MTTKAIEAFYDETMRPFLQEHAADMLIPNDEQIEAGVECPSSGILTGYVIVCEWVGTDGDSWVSYGRPSQQAPWRTRGFLAEHLADL